MLKVGLILVCAGRGKRLSKKIDKALLEIKKGQPLFFYTLKNFFGIKQIKQIIVVLRKKNFKIAKNLLKNIKNLSIKIVEGGKERQESVLKGLSAVDKDITHILIHDGARPFVKKSLIREVIKNLNYFDAVICGINSKDTLKLVSENFVKSTLNRDNIFYIQTPQGFKKDLIIKAYNNLGTRKIFDDAEAVEILGEKIRVIKGDPLNIKITYPQDIVLAKSIVKYFKR